MTHRPTLVAEKPRTGYNVSGLLPHSISKMPAYAHSQRLAGFSAGALLGAAWGGPYPAHRGSDSTQHSFFVSETQNYLVSGCRSHGARLVTPKAIVARLPVMAANMVWERSWQRGWSSLMPRRGPLSRGPLSRPTPRLTSHSRGGPAHAETQRKFSDFRRFEVS